MDPIILVSSVFEYVESQAYPDSDGATGLTSMIALATLLYEAKLLAGASGAIPWVTTVLSALPVSPLVLFYGCLVAAPVIYLAKEGVGKGKIFIFFVIGLYVFLHLLLLLPSTPYQLFPVLSCAFLSYAFATLVALPAIRYLMDPPLVAEGEKVDIEWKQVPWQEWRERVLMGKIFLTLGLAFTSPYLLLVAALQAYTFTVMARRKWVDLRWEESAKDRGLTGFGFQAFKIHQHVPFLIQSNQTCTCPNGHEIAASPEDLTSKIETLWSEFSKEIKVKEKTWYWSYGPFDFSRSFHKEHVCEVELPKDHAISCPECEHPFDEVYFQVEGHGCVGNDSRPRDYVRKPESITWVSPGDAA